MAIDDNTMQARLERVETKIDRLDTKVDRLDTRVDRLETTVSRLETTVSRLDTSVDRLDTRVSRLDTEVKELANANKVQFEHVREDIKKLGEGYEQGLQSISMQISELNRGWTEKWSPHDLALKDHGKRITTLEQRRK